MGDLKKVRLRGGLPQTLKRVSKRRGEKGGNKMDLQNIGIKREAKEKGFTPDHFG